MVVSPRSSCFWNTTRYGTAPMFSTGVAGLTHLFPKMRRWMCDLATFRAAKMTRFLICPDPPIHRTARHANIRLHGHVRNPSFHFHSNDSPVLARLRSRCASLCGLWFISSSSKARPGDFAILLTYHFTVNRQDLAGALQKTPRRHHLRSV